VLPNPCPAQRPKPVPRGKSAGFPGLVPIEFNRKCLIPQAARLLILDITKGYGNSKRGCLLRHTLCKTSASRYVSYSGAGLTKTSRSKNQVWIHILKAISTKHVEFNRILK
jgi:hypothetical protein